MNDPVAQHYIDFFELVEIRNAPGDKAEAVLAEGLISDPKQSILEAVAELYGSGNLTNASILVEEITDVILEPQFGISVNLTDAGTEHLIYEKNTARIAAKFRSPKLVSTRSTRSTVIVPMPAQSPVSP